MWNMNMIYIKAGAPKDHNFFIIIIKRKKTLDFQWNDDQALPHVPTIMWSSKLMALTIKTPILGSFDPQSIWDNFLWEVPMNKRKSEKGKKKKKKNLDP